MSKDGTDRKVRITPVELVILIAIIVIVVFIAAKPLANWSQHDKRADMATAHNIQIVLQSELRQLQNNGGVEFVPGADYNDTYIFNAGGESSPQNAVSMILQNGGVVLPSGAVLTGIDVNEFSALLEGFIYQSGSSKVIYNGATLEQV